MHCLKIWIARLFTAIILIFQPFWATYSVVSLNSRIHFFDLRKRHPKSLTSKSRSQWNLFKILRQEPLAGFETSWNRVKWRIPKRNFSLTLPVSHWQVQYVMWFMISSLWKKFHFSCGCYDVPNNFCVLPQRPKSTWRKTRQTSLKWRGFLHLFIS